VAGEDKAIGVPVLAAGTSTMARARWSATSAGPKSLHIPGTILPGAMAGRNRRCRRIRAFRCRPPLLWSAERGDVRMTELQPIRFIDGAGYEQMMGIWSRSAGEVFLDWLAPSKGLRWADIGCGNGAFTELVVERCAPAHVVGVDPSPQQLAYARQRHTAGLAEFVQGDAMALPVADRSVDAATMALVIFFVPDPAKGVAEMRRVVRPGGVVAAYAWDFTTGGFPWQLPQDEVRATGATVPWPPQAEIVRIDRLHQLWADAGLQSVASREIVVERVFPSFDEFWRVAMLTPVLGALVEALPADTLAGVKERVRAALRIEGGKVVHTGKANAVKGVVPR